MINLLLSKEKATELFNAINVMPGAGQHRLLRHRIQLEIKSLWPELTDGKPPEKGIVLAPRVIKLDDRQMRALAEGILILMAGDPRDGNSNGGNFAVLHELAVSCRCWTWVEEQLTKHLSQVPEFGSKELDAVAEETKAD